MRAAQTHKHGFTLIELMVTVVIMAIITGVGVASYNTFNRRQQLRRAATQVVTELRTVQKRADSGQIPTSATTCGVLDSYSVNLVSGAYDILFTCDGGIPVQFASVSLPSNVTFSTTDTLEFKTELGSGGLSYFGPSTVVLTHSQLPTGSNTRTINITAAGAINEVN